MFAAGKDDRHIGVVLTKHLVLYDGECGLCQFSVQWLLDKDVNQELYFAPLQGETAKHYLSSGQIPDDLDSLIYVRQEKEIFWYSTGVLELSKVLPRPWSWGIFALYIPKILRDGVYRLVAANRLRFFKAPDSCRLPKAEEVSRFLP